MSRLHVDQKEIAAFAAAKVNLPRDAAGEYRAQAQRLRTKLEGYLAEHPDFELRKLLLSGSLAKGTALRSLNDIDVACYVSGASAPSDVPALVGYIAERLRTAFPNFQPDQVTPKTYCVTVSFRGTGLDVDIVPILYDEDPDWYGRLVSQDDGSFLWTCIPRHLEFSVARRKLHETHFSQVVRLVKYWVRKEKRERPGFRFKSFMVELVLSHLSDEGQSFDDYPEAMQAFFTYLARTGFSERIAFADYFPTSTVGVCSDPIQVFDPVNPENNAASRYSRQDVEVICDAALDAGDAIDAALLAPTKGETVSYWKRVFGPSFSA